MYLVCTLPLAYTACYTAIVISDNFFLFSSPLNSGVYKLSVKVDGKEKVQGFTVESYTEERFKIEFNNLKAAYAPTDKVEFDINAKYFFGEPVVDATVIVTDDHTGKKEEFIIEEVEISRIELEKLEQEIEELGKNLKELQDFQMENARILKIDNNSIMDLFSNLSN